MKNECTFSAHPFPIKFYLLNVRSCVRDGKLMSNLRVKNSSCFAFEVPSVPNVFSSTVFPSIFYFAFYSPALSSFNEFRIIGETSKCYMCDQTRLKSIIRFIYFGLSVILFRILSNSSSSYFVSYHNASLSVILL